MREELAERFFKFAVNIVRLARRLSADRFAIDVSRQLMRSATSIGANWEEAMAGLSKSDFTHSANISRKEARETYYWLKIAAECFPIAKEEGIIPLITECNEIVSILTSIVKRKQTGNKSIVKIIIVAFFFFSSLILHPSSLLFAADSNVGTEGAVFLKIPTGSPRAQALGNCGVSLAEGAEAIAINPAGIASSQMREVSFSYLSWLQDYSGQYLGYVHPIGQSVVGLNAAYYGIKNFDVRNQEGVPQYGADVKVRNGYAALTLAKSFFLEKFLVGVSAKEVMEDNYAKKYQNLVFDAGAVLKLFRKLSLGWAGQNFSGRAKEVVKVQRLGLAYSFNPFLTVALEQKSYSDSGAKAGGGVEFNLPEEVLQVGRVSFRAGYTAGDNHGKNMDDKTLDTLGMNNTSGWAFGIGIFSAQALGYGMGLDYTMAPYGALGKASQLSLKFQF